MRAWKRGNRGRQTNKPNIGLIIKKNKRENGKD